MKHAETAVGDDREGFMGGSDPGDADGDKK